MLKKTKVRLFAAAIAIAASLSGVSYTAAQQNNFERQQQMLSVLKSGQPAEKAIVCKQLAVYGDETAVPELAKLLPDKELSSWARIALEAIPGAASTDALRLAIDKVEGPQLIGVINSVSRKRDPKAVGPLTAKLNGGDAAVAEAAAAALGNIGTDAAAQSLAEALGNEKVRAAAAEGSVVCAERFLQADKKDEAIKIYEAVRNADVPKQRKLEAIRGAILARGEAGVPLLVEQLKSEDKDVFGIALFTARELKVPAVTDALVAELTKTTPARQALLLEALADRNDAKALPAVTEAARSGDAAVRAVAASVLGRLGDVSSVPVLLDAAASDDAKLSRAAKQAITGLTDKAVDADILSRLDKAGGRQRQVLIELAELRKIEGSMDVFAKAAADADAGVRLAAIEAIGNNGADKQVPALGELLVKTKEQQDRAAIEKALSAIAGRWGKACVPHLIPVAKAGEAENRAVALRVLATCGGPEALATVGGAVSDADETVSDAAVRTLTNWPNRWPEDVSVTETLMGVAKGAKKPTHQVLALRGILQFALGAKKVDAGTRLAKVKAAIPLATRPEEKRLAISALQAIGGPGVLEPIAAFTSDPATAEEAGQAIVTLLSKPMPGASKEQRQRALQAVVGTSKNDGTKKKAQELLAAIK